MGRSLYEHAPFRVHGTFVGFVIRCLSRTQSLTAANQHFAEFFPGPLWPNICPGMNVFVACGGFLKTGLPGHFGAKSRFIKHKSRASSPAIGQPHIVPVFLCKGQINLVLSLSSFQQFLANVETIRGHVLFPPHPLHGRHHSRLIWSTW